MARHRTLWDIAPSSHYMHLSDVVEGLRHMRGFERPRALHRAPPGLFVLAAECKYTGMLNIIRVLGHSDDPDMAARLHDLAHHGAIEYLHIAPPDIARHRFRAVTDRGTACGIALPRHEHLSDGAVLLLEVDRAIVVRLGMQRWLRLRPIDSAAGLELGYQAGNLHWKVRFDAGDLLIAQDGPLEDYLARLAPLLDAQRVVVLAEENAS